jgi:DNA topoisomerase-1
MLTSLVIVESPAKCKKIESYLGPGYKVVASYGHLRNLTDLAAIDISNNFAPNYSIIKDDFKLKQIEKLRSEIAKAYEVILATDDDREGESIAWHICDLFNLPIDKTKRIIFHEITETAIKTAILNPVKINMNTVNAQKSRQIIDVLVGFTITPILWNCVTKNHNNSLSAGRCQTPALRLIYENYLEINKNPGTTVYNTIGYFTNLILPFELNKQFTNKNEVLDFLEKSESGIYECSTTSPKKVLKKSPDPLTTSSLQQLASNELHYSPKDTMKYAQELYEAGYITYMRTDSKKYSGEFIENVKEYIIKTYDATYVNANIEELKNGNGKGNGKGSDSSNGSENGSNDEKQTNKKTSKKATKNTSKKEKEKEKEKDVTAQEAHEAIRPVSIIKTPSMIKNSDRLNAKAVKLYEIIWERTLESLMSSAHYSSITAKIAVYDDFYFSYKAELIIFHGWQIVQKKYEQSSNSYQYLLLLKQNSIIKPKKIESKFTLNQLKMHYTEARLVQLLEEKGIGRPSTFASLIDKIQERGYVEKKNIKGQELECIDFISENNNISEKVYTREFGNEKNKLVITPLGIIVIELLLKHFDDFFKYEYTKNMENNLDLIANGEKVWDTLCDECYNDLLLVTKDLENLKKFSIKIDDEHFLIIGKHGPVVKKVNLTNKKDVSFLNVKKDLDINKLNTEGININLNDILDNEPSNENAIGKYKGCDLFIRNGKYGFYAQWGTNKISLKEFDVPSIDKFNYIDVIRFLDIDTVLDTSKPVGLVRELNKNLSIRNGKYGDYILYKKPRMQKPSFFKLNDFKDNYNTCNKDVLLNWIKQKYNIE